MNGARVGDRTVVDKCILAEKVTVGNDCQLGVGEEVPNKWKPDIYAFGLVTVGEGSVIPGGVKVGKNTAISGETTPSDYPGGILESGGSIIKAGDVK
jgi:glucose-1-phosphate adenylyltransferase